MFTDCNNYSAGKEQSNDREQLSEGPCFRQAVQRRLFCRGWILKLDLGNEKEELRWHSSQGKHCVHRKFEELQEGGHGWHRGEGVLQAGGGQNTQSGPGVGTRRAEPRDLRKFRVCPLEGSGALLRRARPGAFGSRSRLQNPTGGAGWSSLQTPPSRLGKQRRQHTHRPWRKPGQTGRSSQVRDQVKVVLNVEGSRGT